jgi:hypothetical protein
MEVLLMKKVVFLVLAMALIAANGMSVFALKTTPESYAATRSANGAVISIEQATEGLPYYRVQIGEGDTVTSVFTINDKSFNAGETAVADIKPGDRFTGWYDTTGASITIYPPEHPAVVYAANMETGIAAVDIFHFMSDGTMLNRAGDLVLNMETNVNSDGTPIYGPEIDGKLLVVYSDMIMPSSPAQTVPKKIVALDYTLQVLEPAVSDDWESGYYVNGVRVDTPIGYYVDDVKIDAPMYFGNEQGDMMIPLRAVAEAMGYTVHWEATMNAVILNNNVTVTIGSADYSVARMAPISLNSAAEIIDGRTYVPHTFFSEVLKAEIEITESDDLWRVDISK